MDKIINELINKAKKDPTILALAFFGSYARGEKHQDIDVCIFLVPKEYSPKSISQKKLEYTPEQEKYDIQVFQQLPFYIRKRILAEAQIIYCRDEDLLYDLYFETLRELSHYQYIYESYLGEVANG